MWWSEAEKHNVLPLDDRFGARFAENAARFQGARNNFTFHAGMGHVPTDVRSRSYTIEAHVEIDDAGGRDRGSPVSPYEAPFEFTGRLLRVAMHNDQKLDGNGVGVAEMARQ